MWFLMKKSLPLLCQFEKIKKCIAQMKELASGSVYTLFFIKSELTF